MRTLENGLQIVLSDTVVGAGVASTKHSVVWPLGHPRAAREDFVQPALLSHDLSTVVSKSGLYGWKARAYLQYAPHFLQCAHRDGLQHEPWLVWSGQTQVQRGVHRVRRRLDTPSVHKCVLSFRVSRLTYTAVYRSGDICACASRLNYNMHTVSVDQCSPAIAHVPRGPPSFPLRRTASWARCPYPPSR